MQSSQYKNLPTGFESQRFRIHIRLLKNLIKLKVDGKLKVFLCYFCFTLLNRTEIKKDLGLFFF